ncbi:cyclic nucleotide-binding domain-containing protein [uncultured Mucilaginibacter sp.]|uniref:Crp/Fnr family transcriptional regulator n=1 Tax=uncultured Mucilaginibacter sp. TaxID=797541 RepID=UPI00261197BE|nr:cyclic nucleotide-binding domain-containing protein [uncultured Mucilaginibacter sp.]
MKEIKQGCNLNDCFLCKHCLKDWVPAIGIHKKNFELKKGQQLFKEGNAVTGIYFVFLGKVKVHKRWDDEKELITRFAQPGDIIGHLGLGNDPVYPVSATAIEQSMVCYIALPFFESTLNVNPQLTYSLMKFFANELQESDKRMRNLVHMPVKERIALALLTLKKQFGINPEGSIAIELSRQDLSSFAAVSYETLFKVINEFLLNGFIEVTGKSFRLINEKALSAMALNI